MDLIENNNFGTRAKSIRTDILITPQESFINGVYKLADEAVGCGLDRLRIEDGIISSCQKGCCHCCRYYIQTNIAESHALGQYIKRTFSAYQINALRIRTQQWHEWEDSRPGKFQPYNIERQTDLSNYIHRCPLLVNDICSAYSVRPIACRTHFVRSNPLRCLKVNDPKSTEPSPIVLNSIVAATSPFLKLIKNHIEDTDVDFSRSIMLLPHWLAIEMEWDFAISK
ncbi:MAG: hypothetical protein K9L30_07940 [Desulfobacterales bacterium]|nr:hypothetical protein [Desulfobacterales bacterium]